MTLCIMPCADSGCSHENAWSMRMGAAVGMDRPALQGWPESPAARLLSGVLGLIMAGSLKAR